VEKLEKSRRQNSFAATSSHLASFKGLPHEPCLKSEGPENRPLLKQSIVAALAGRRALAALPAPLASAAFRHPVD
jgi:hypothetical protein